MARRVLIAGYYGHGNAGDEAILAALLRDLSGLAPDRSFTVASGNPARTLSEHAGHGVAAVADRDIPALVEAVRASDLVILGGGGLFQDYWEVDPEVFLTPRHGGIYSYLLFPVLAALLGRPAVIYAVGVGPLRTAEGRRLTRAAFELCRRATVRDDASLALLREIGVSGVPIEVTADPAFGLPPAPAGEVDSLLAELGAERGEPLLGVSLRHWEFGADPAAWEAGVARGLDRFLAEFPGRVLFLPFQSEETGPPEDDLAVCRRVRGALADPGRALLVERLPRPEVMAGLLGRCERVLAMRFHAVLFSLAAGVPVVNLAYDPKTSSLMGRAGLGGFSLPPEDWREEPVAAALRRAEAPVAGFAEPMRGLARRSAEAAVEALAAGPVERSTADAFLGELALGKALAVVRLEGELSHRNAQIERQWGELRQAAEWLEGVRAEVERVTAERDSGRESQQRLREQRDLLLRERNDLARRLDELEGTVAYRLVSRFWALMRRLFPERSRRRGLYRGVRRLLNRILGTPASQPSGIASFDEPGGGGPDPRGDLLRFEEQVRERGAKQVVAFFSATQLLESEGQRPTQLALELSRRGIPVVFCYWRWWPHEWCVQDRMEEGIVQVPIDVVLERPEMLSGAFAGLDRVALFEFPYPGFFEMLAAANAAGWITVYDVLDDWEEFHRVGQAIWYDEPFERHLIAAADAVFAINELLAVRVRELGGAGAGILGNGLKPGLDTVDEPRPLARGEVTVGYFGYLAGAWFDWELIAEAARRRPSWKFYLIGYGGSPEGIELPDNVVLLGKKPQGELASWAANWDVAVIPFKPDRLAAGADPIKTYEYLAMGLPVVATGVYPPAGGEAFVTRAEGVEEFLACLLEAARDGDPEAAAARRAFAASCTWGARLEALLAAVERGEQRVAEKRALCGGVGAA
jgi:polysaccharide pyruvyl transferase CsaB